jgi:hypothetical protein
MENLIEHRVLIIMWKYCHRSGFISPSLTKTPASLIPNPNTENKMESNVDLPMLPSTEGEETQYPSSKGLQNATLRTTVPPGFLLFAFGTMLFYFTIMKPSS